jgi:ABC-2 type transport system ATP-binding protein
MKYSLEISNVSKVYKSGTKALKTVSLAVESGDFFALLGANGAGKSTLIGILTDTVTKTAGTIKIAGFNTDTEFPQAKKKIGIMPQEFNFDTYQTVYNIVFNQAGFFGIGAATAKKTVTALLKEVNLWEKRSQPAHTLSGGMKRRLLLARALVNNPEILIVDEPTAGVDVELRHEIWNLLKKLNQQGTTIILTTHYLEEVEYLCNTMAMIHEGAIIAQGKVNHILSELTDRVYSIEFAAPLQTKDIKTHGLLNVQNHKADIKVPNQQTITSIVEKFTHSGLQAVDVRPKMNRMEQFFLQKLTEKSA